MSYSNRILSLIRVVVILLVFGAVAGCLEKLDTGLDEQSIQGDIELVVPPPWRLYGPVDGSPAYEFVAGLDMQILRSGSRSACFLAVEASNDDQARWTQRFKADRWRGKRVRFAAYLKSYKVGEWAGLWMRVDTDTKQSYAFDDSEDRSLKGTTDWTLFEVVLDVPENAAIIYIGAHLFGRGQVWMDDCVFGEVGEDVSATDGHRLRGGYPRQFTISGFLNDEPLNLGFEENETM
jgi:hypothetical protein